MTVAALRHALRNLPDDTPVSIRIETPEGLVCPDGAVCDVNSAGRGIDWHGHEFMIRPKYRLRLRDDAEIDKWRGRK